MDVSQGDKSLLERVAAKALRLWEKQFEPKSSPCRPRRLRRGAADVESPLRTGARKNLDDIVKKVVYREKQLTFVDLVRKYVRERFDGKASLAYKAAGVSRQAYSAMISKEGRMVEKRTAVAFALAFGLDKNEAKVLIKSAGWSLAASIKEDAVFLECFAEGIRSLLDVNYILDKCGCRPLPIN